MMKTGRQLLAASLVLLSTTARGQERRKFTPVRATNEPVAASPRFDGGIAPVEVGGPFDFHDLNDEFEPDRDPQISAVDAIEKVLDTRSPGRFDVSLRERTGRRRAHRLGSTAATLPHPRHGEEQREASVRDDR